MKGLSLVALLVLGALLFRGGQAVLESPALRLKDFEVRGNGRVTTEELVGATGVEVGDHLLAVSTGEVSERLMQLPWIAGARVERILPSSLKLTVEEREPSMVVEAGQVSYLADSKGRILQEGTEDLLRISLPTGVAVTTGSDIDSVEFVHATRIFRSLPAAIRRRIVSIDAPSIDTIQLETTGGHLIYYGAGERLEEKNLAVQSLFDPAPGPGERNRIIDVRVPSHPVTRSR